MSRGLTFSMPYIKDLSVNHYLGRRKGGRYYVKQEVKEWMEELGWKIKLAHIEDWRLPLQVTCFGMFKDKRSTPDLSNLSKVTLDAIEEVTGINDRDMRWHDGDIKHDKTGLGVAYLTITIEEDIEKK